MDITNLNTKDNPTEYLDYYRQEAVISANNLFQAAVNGLLSSPSLKNFAILPKIRICWLVIGSVGDFFGLFDHPVSHSKHG